MTAVDTNILLRVITRDSEPEARRAFALLKNQERILIPKTVLLELEWVLRRSYGYSPEQILALYHELLNTPTIELEDEAAITQAITWFERGMDFADSLHVASSGPECTFATFDVALQRMALRLGACKIIVP